MGFQVSTAYSTNGINQVGFATGNGIGGHAILWSGTADSAIDLNSLLPFQSGSSTAYTIDAQGNIWGIANDMQGNLHAVEWSPVPEPATCALFAAGALGLLAVRLHLFRRSELRAAV
jgi:hypothetical protein